MLNWLNILYDVEFMPFFLYMSNKKRRDGKPFLTHTGAPKLKSWRFSICILNSAMKVTYKVVYFDIYPRNLTP